MNGNASEIVCVSASIAVVVGIVASIVVELLVNIGSSDVITGSIVVTGTSLNIVVSGVIGAIVVESLGVVVVMDFRVCLVDDLRFKAAPMIFLGDGVVLRLNPLDLLVVRLDSGLSKIIS